MSRSDTVDGRYYQVARAGTVAERLVALARDRIYDDFLAATAPSPETTILDVGVSDVLTDAANVLERRYPHQDRIAAVGLGTAEAFRAAFPGIAYQQIEAGAPLPFPDNHFDVATCNAVLEHVGSPAGQVAFLRELVRVGRTVYLTVPHRFFPVEHHTGLPFLHWTDASFALACRLAGKREWTDPATLILMTTARLRAIAEEAAPGRTIRLGRTGIPLGPFSSNLSLVIDAA